MAYKYTVKDYNKEHMAKVAGRALPISTKAAINICNNLKKRSVAYAKMFLKEVMILKTPVKYTRFTNGAGHKRGNMAAGKYPINAAKHILKLIESVESNAQFKGLNTSNLIIVSILAQHGGNQWRHGRQRRRKMKRTHVEIIVEEGKSKESKIKGSKKIVKKEVDDKVKKEQKKATETKVKASVKNPSVKETKTEEK